MTRLFDEILEDGDVFVDVGAHVGYYSLIASRIVGCTGIVYALEPHPTTHRVLLANLALNRAQNVKPLAVAAGARHGRGSIASPRARDAAQMSLLGDNGDATAVSIAPLSELVDETHHPRLRLIKIDVEGFEDQVLQGLEPVLARGVRRAVLIEVHAHLNPGVRQPIAEFVGRTGLHAHLVQDDAGYDRTFRLPETAGLTPVTAEWIAHTELDHFELLLRSET